MKYVIDHDFHIHSQLSACSSDPLQSTEAILDYGRRNGFTKLCLTDHLWDDKVPGASDWYAPQSFAHICQALPLPQDERVRFCFGAETEIDRRGVIGLSREVMEKLDFIIVPTTHMHMSGFTIDGSAGAEERARAYVDRFDMLMDAGLPYRKVGIAHLTTELIYRLPDKPLVHLSVLNLVSDADYLRLFRRAASLGMGIELNLKLSAYPVGEARDAVLRPYRLARRAGCRFYFGSDAHHPAGLEAAPDNFRSIADALELTEEEKFTF